MKRATFDEILKENNNPAILPLMHATTAFKFINILNSGILDVGTENCPGFSEKLLCFFYGKAAYPVAKNEKPRADNSYLPIGFVVKYDDIKIKHIYPFDTGAYVSQLYKDFYNKEMPLESFELENDKEILQKFISSFYDNNLNYILSKPQNIDSYDYECMELQCYINAITNKTATDLDNRCRTVEITTDCPVCLKKSLLAIIIPEILQDKKEFKSFKTNAEIITYDWFANEAPSTYFGVVREKVRKYLTNNHYL